MNAHKVFHPAFGNRPERIVGREETLDRLLAALDAQPGDRERATLITGQRGMGKTALLLELADRASRKDFVVARVTASEVMTDEIIECIQINGAQHVKGRKPAVKGFSAGALGFSFGLTFAEGVRENYGFRVQLSMLCDRLEESGKGVMILVDEVQPDTAQMRLLATTYQHLVGDGKNIAIIMAGLPSAISSVPSDNILTFLNRATHVDLGPLSLGDVGAYYASVFSQAGKSFAPGQLDAAVEATRGFPYLLQLVGYYVLSYAQDASVITQEIVEQALLSAKRDMVKNVYEASLKELSDKDIEFLMAMSQDDGASKVADIQNRLGVEKGYVQPYRARLIKAGVITSPRRGELEFTVPYLAEHLRSLKS